MTTSITEKIRKIMAIAGDGAASEEEIENALRHAQRLMDKHHLTEDDLAHAPEDDYATVDRATFGDHRSWVGVKMYAWETRLSQFVADLVGVKIYCDYVRPMRVRGVMQFSDDGKRKRGRSFVFFGVDEDAHIAAEMFDELRLMIAAMARLKWGQVYVRDGGAYCEGFVSGLQSKLCESRDAEKLEAQRCIAQTDASDRANALVLIERRTALVKYKRDKASEWLSKEKGIKLRSGGSRGGASGSGDARREGHSDGRAANVSAIRRRKLAN